MCCKAIKAKLIGVAGIAYQCLLGQSGCSCPSIKDRHGCIYFQLGHQNWILEEQLVAAWSSLDKEESLACHITSSFNNKLGCFYNKIKKKIVLQKQHFFLLNGEVIWLASDSPYLQSSMVTVILYLQAQLLQYVQDASITFIVTLSIWCRVFCVCEYFKIKIIYKDCP